MSRLNPKGWNEIKTNDSWAIFKIMGEFVQGFEKMSKIGPCISLFGSARTKKDNEYYKLSVEIAESIVKSGYGVITGGGPGIMEAANLGAYKTDQPSVGLQIELPFEASANDYIDELVDCRYFFTRKVFFLKYSQAFVACPGGFGTFDELFETLTLIQTGHMRKVPIVLVGKDYWDGLVEWIKDVVLKKESNIGEKDLDLFKVVDTAEEAMDYMLDMFDSSDTIF